MVEKFVCHSGEITEGMEPYHVAGDGDYVLHSEYAALEARCRKAENAILEHNQSCVSVCGRTNGYNAKVFGCESYLSRGRQCPTCPMQDFIDLTAPETTVNDCGLIGGKDG